MNMIIVVLFAVLVGSVCHCKEIKVAVIDTGFGMTLPNNPKPHAKLCKTGHWNFVTDSSDVMDTHGHGTNISGLIDDMVNEDDEDDGGEVETAYCQIIFKFFEEDKPTSMMDWIYSQKDRSPGSIPPPQATNLTRELAALQKAIDLKVDFINMSLGGIDPSKKEKVLIKKALDAGIVIVAAAGNENTKLTNKSCRYFPACYDRRIIVVGNLNQDGTRHKRSNYGRRVTHMVIGTDILANGITLSGSSQSAAKVTGRLIRQAYKDSLETE